MKLTTRLVVVMGVAAISILPATHASASCAPSTNDQDWRRADVVFVGTSRPSADLGYTDFEVEAYYKGFGPARAHVRTGQMQPGVSSSVDLDVPAGHRWVVYAYGNEASELHTNACSGSRRLPDGGGLPLAEALGAPTAIEPREPEPVAETGADVAGPIGIALILISIGGAVLLRRRVHPVRVR